MPVRDHHRNAAPAPPQAPARGAEPGRELRWIGRVGPGGIFDGEHTFTITQVRPGVVLFTQREDFTGVAVPFYQHWLHTDTLPMFRAMDAALAREAGNHG